MVEYEKVKQIPFGGDYNPEQWPEETWEDDFHLLKKAHINIMTLNVFNWALLQPDETTYCFDKLDKVMELTKKYGVNVCMATSTGAHPAWMARKYPDILRVTADGKRRKYGRRHNACQNSPTYRKYAKALTEQLAARYADCGNIVAWHISNEYGGVCYCENCEKKFRIWLQKKYKTTEELNRVWNLNFWSHTMYDWEDVVVPNLLSEEFEDDGIRTMFQGISLDYARFNSDGMLECFNMEKEIVKKYMPDVPVTTNFMGAYKPIDYQKWGESLDFVSWDNYPNYDDGPAEIAMRHDLMRGLKNGKPFALMEQTPGVSNWQEVCKLKRPGVLRLWSYQAVAHGSDTVMFFQMKQNIGACEKFHTAFINHVGTGETRVFREASELGAELEKKIKGLTLGARTDAKIAIIFDWDNWWAAENSAGPSRRIRYVEEAIQYYKALYEMNYPVDIISVETELSGYQFVIAPLLYMCKTGFDEKVRNFVREGGTFLTTYFSGYVEEHDLVVCGGYPGKLKDILGIWVEESDALPKEEENCFSYGGNKVLARILCDLLHLQGAEALGVYEKDFYAGMPAVTKNKFGQGNAYYVGTRADESFYRGFLKEICDELRIKPAACTNPGIEAAVRKNANGTFLFLLNHNSYETSYTVERPGLELLGGKNYSVGEELKLGAYDVRILLEAE